MQAAFKSGYEELKVWIETKDDDADLSFVSSILDETRKIVDFTPDNLCHPLVVMAAVHNRMDLMKMLVEKYNVGQRLNILMLYIVLFVLSHIRFSFLVILFFFV